MITFTIIAICAIIIIKFLIYISKSENQIDVNNIEKKFKPFVDTIINRYLQNSIKCTIETFDDDKKCLIIRTEELSINDDSVSHFIYFKDNFFYVELNYTIFSLNLKKIYSYKLSEMDGQRQIKEAKDILSNFFDLRLKFEVENEVAIIEQIMQNKLYN